MSSYREHRENRERDRDRGYDRDRSYDRRDDRDRGYDRDRSYDRRDDRGGHDDRRRSSFGGSGRGKRPSFQKAATNDRKPSEVQVFVQFLPTDMSERDLISEVSKFFGKIGKIKCDQLTKKERIWCYKEQGTGNLKGECTITYCDNETQEKALDLNGEYFLGQKIEVTRSIVRAHMAAPPPPSRGGGRGRGRGGRGGGRGRGGGGDRDRRSYGGSSNANNEPIGERRSYGDSRDRRDDRRYAPY